MRPGPHFVLIGLCTYRRPKLLSEALESLTKLKIPPNLKVELLLVDNEDSPANRAAFKQIQRKLPFKAEYRIEPQRGIAYARNRVLEAALEKKAQAIAFFDDDAKVTPDWLARLYGCFLEKKVEVVTGPQRSVLPDTAPLWAHKSEFLQAMSFATGTQRPWAATHNVFFDIKLVDEWGLRFDTDFALSGGEDQFFFMQAVQKGARIHWLEEAVLSEKLPPERLRLNWILQRNFRYSSAGAKFYQKLFGRSKASLLCLAKGSLYLAYGLFFILPFAFLALLPSTRHHSIQALAYIARGLGWFLGWGGYRYEEYRRC